MMGYRRQLSRLKIQKILKRLPWLCLMVGLILLALPMIVVRLNRLELQSFDERQLSLQQNRFDHPISIIEIDNASLNNNELKQAFGRYPWRREIYAYVLRYLERGQAKMAVFEPSFNGGEDLEHPDSDRNFAQAVSPNLPVVIALSEARKEDLRPYESIMDRERLFLALKRGRVYNHGDGPLPEVKYYDAFQIPITPLLQSQAQFYPIDNLVFDQNGRVRQVYLFGWGNSRHLKPTIPTAAALNGQHHFQIQPDGSLLLDAHPVQLHKEPKPIIKWYGNALHPQKPVYPRYSILQILKSEIAFECQQNPHQSICGKVRWKGVQQISPAIFKDRYVLTGYQSTWYDSNGFSTLYDHQLNRGSGYPNIFIQANILDNLLSNDFISRPGWRIRLPWVSQEPISLVTGGMMLLMFILTWVAIHRLNKILPSLAFTVLLALGYTWLTHAVYHHYNLWLNWVYPITTLALTYGGTYLYRFTHSEKRKQQLRQTFARYMCPSSMAYIEENMALNQLAGQRRQLTSMFCDIRGFTRFAEQYPPVVVQQVLTEYFTQMNAIIIHEYKGVINKLIGDAILAYWGFPIEREDDPYLAVCAALAMKEVADQWELDPTKPTLRIGIGINTGDAMVGDIGSDDFMDFTVIGDSVNVASRLEKLNKRYGTTIIISQSTYDLVKDRIHARYIGKVRLPGKSVALDLYEPTGLKIYGEPAKPSEALETYGYISYKQF